MPLAGDAFLSSQLPLSHSPLARIGYQGFKPEFDPLKVLQQVIDFFEKYGLQAIEDLTGIDLSILQPLVDVFKAITSGDLTKLPELFGNLFSFLSFDLLDPSFNVTAAAQQFVQSIVKPFVQLLFSFIQPSWLPLLPFSQIGNVFPNLLTAGSFPSADNVNGEGIFSWISGGLSAPGAVQVVADGTLKQLFSNEIPVSEGQQLQISGKAKWSGLPSTGTPIVLGLATYSGSEAGGNAAEVALPDIASVGGVSSDWTAMSGTYTVPAGVNSVRARLAVKPAATVGTINFDDVDLHKTTGDAVISWIPGLPELFNDFASLIDRIFNAFTGNTGISGVGLPALFDALQGFTSGLDDAFTNIINGAVGQGSPSGTGLVAQVFDAVLGLFGIGTTAQSAANTANTQIAVVVANQGTPSGGVSFSDTFDRPPATDLGSDWNQLYSGGGTGTLGTDGSGNATWTSGAGAKSCVALYNTPLNTDYQVVSSVFIYLAGGSTLPQIHLIGRSDSSASNYVRAVIVNGSPTLSVQRVVGGTVTNLASVNMGLNSGDLFEFFIGDATNDRHFVLKRNGVTAIDVTESGTASLMGASNRYGGFAYVPGADFGGGQIAPGTVAVVTMADKAI